MGHISIFHGNIDLTLRVMRHSADVGRLHVLSKMICRHGRRLRMSPDPAVRAEYQALKADAARLRRLMKSDGPGALINRNHPLVKQWIDNKSIDLTSLDQGRIRLLPPEFLTRPKRTQWQHRTSEKGV